MARLQPKGDSQCMFSVAQTQDDQSIAFPVVLILLIVGGTIYTLGYLRAVMHRANKDYKTTKAAVPVLRKGFWLAWWSAVKVGFWVVLAGIILVAWMVRDVRDSPENANSTPKPTPSVTKSVPPRR